VATMRFFTDEDVYRAIAEKLREAGYDAVSTPDADRLGEHDESQLKWASHENRTLITFNVADFARLHHEWMDASRHHAGIVVSSQRPIGHVTRRLLNLANTLDADEMQDRLEFLSNW